MLGADIELKEPFLSGSAAVEPPSLAPLLTWHGGTVAPAVPVRIVSLFIGAQADGS